MKRRAAFTLVELLVVIAIIALLVSILVPALNRARTMARVTATRALLHSIGVGLEQFMNDTGSYPSSTPSSPVPTAGFFDGSPAPGTDASWAVGAHHLAEAMVGIDQLGYSRAREYCVDAGTGQTCLADGTPVTRQGPYLNSDNVLIDNLARAEEAVTDDGAVDRDVWDNPNIVLLDEVNTRLPTPILYYRANTRGSLIHTIYDYGDNAAITGAFEMSGPPADYTQYGDTLKEFEYFVWDQNTGAGTGGDRIRTPSARPYNRDSFILISAGPDAEFGTDDDITNFTRRR